jgi:hypothetical protein
MEGLCASSDREVSTLWRLGWSVDKQQWSVPAAWGLILDMYLQQEGRAGCTAWSRSTGRSLLLVWLIQYEQSAKA